MELLFFNCNLLHYEYFPLEKQKKRIPLQVEKLTKSDPDLIGLCEVFGDINNHAMNECFRSKNYHYYSINESGIAVASKKEISDINFVKFNKCIVFDCFVNKGFLKVIYNEIPIYITHIQANYGALNENQHIQLKQLNQLNKVLEKEKKYILMGDLNVEFFENYKTHQNGKGLDYILTKKMCTYPGKQIHLQGKVHILLLRYIVPSNLDQLYIPM